MQFIIAGKDISDHFGRYKYSEKVFVLRNFPLNDIIKKAQVKKEEKKNNETILIYAGTLTEDRGIKEIVAAMQYLGDTIRLILIGDFVYPDFEKEVKNIADKRVDFLGHVAYQKVFEYLVNADIGMILFLPNAKQYRCRMRTKQ